MHRYPVQGREAPIGLQYRVIIGARPYQKSVHHDNRTFGAQVQSGRSRVVRLQFSEIGHEKAVITGALINLHSNYTAFPMERIACIWSFDLGINDPIVH